MEIKKIVLLVLFISLLSGCNLLDTEVNCNKTANTENYNYNIDMRLIFDNKNELKRVVSNIRYQLTDKGMESIDNLKENLNNKSMEYSLYDEINFDYKITEKLIEVSEEIKDVIKKGDRVVWPAMLGVEINVEGNDYTVLKKEDVLMLLK